MCSRNKDKVRKRGRHMLERKGSFREKRHARGVQCRKACRREEGE